MRFRAVACFFFLIFLIAIGCRQPLTPNIDRNQAPETFITAAPQDTITVRSSTAPHDPTAPVIGTISVRFHPYWAGADYDGEVAGFYFAVVETLPLPPPGFSEVPPLPGPKPQDYHFTTRTDSMFIFKVSESVPDRQHAFFIFAVDNQGKADPTPARVIFNALDRFPPRARIDLAVGSGTVFFTRPGGIIERQEVTKFVTDSLTRANSPFPPKDTLPLNARLDFRWSAEPVIAGTYVTGYQYKLDEARFVPVDSSVHAASYNTGVGGDVVQPGVKVFTLRAIDQAGGSSETNRRFQLNYAPDTWFSGPDPALYVRRRPDGTPDPAGERFVEVPDWNNPPVFPGSLLSCDSITTWPSERPKRKTFFEIYDLDGSGPVKDRVYVRSEGDTVHMNSWVVIPNGGSDLDSPYAVKVNSIDPSLPDSSQCNQPIKGLTPGPPNGSPIGFHVKFTVFPDPNGPTSSLSFTTLYPVFDPVSNFPLPLMLGYGEMNSSGKEYVLVQAEDANGLRDQSIFDAKVVADRIDAIRNPSPEDQALRDKILTFYVNKAPRLLFESPVFFPRIDDTVRTVTVTGGNRIFDINIPADDVDPLDPNTRPPYAGGPSTGKVLRWIVTIRGQKANGDTAMMVVNPDFLDQFSPNIHVVLPSRFVGSRDTVSVQLCDCPTCELTPGQGRCVKYDIPIRIRPPAVAEAAAPELIRSRPGPGPSQEGLRRRDP